MSKPSDGSMKRNSRTPTGKLVDIALCCVVLRCCAVSVVSANVTHSSDWFIEWLNAFPCRIRLLERFSSFEGDDDEDEEEESERIDRQRGFPPGIHSLSFVSFSVHFTPNSDNHNSDWPTKTCIGSRTESKWEPKQKNKCKTTSIYQNVWSQYILTWTSLIKNPVFEFLHCVPWTFALTGPNKATPHGPAESLQMR